MSKQNGLTANSIELSSKTKKENNKLINWLKEVKSSFNLKKIFTNANKRKHIKGLSTIDIELEIAPAFKPKQKKNYFLHYFDNKSQFYHIYFDEGI